MFAIMMAISNIGTAIGEGVATSLTDDIGFATVFIGLAVGSKFAGILLLLPLILVLLWSSRSQHKRQQAAIAALKKGDRVVTQSGLVGKLLDIGDRYAKLEIAPGVKVEVLKSGLVGKDTGDAKVEGKK